MVSFNLFFIFLLFLFPIFCFSILLPAAFLLGVPVGRPELVLYEEPCKQSRGGVQGPQACVHFCEYAQRMLDLQYGPVRIREVKVKLNYKFKRTMY